MRLLLTSAGISNTSIHDALVDLLGKPIAESSALVIPTAAYACPGVGAGMAWRLISGSAKSPLCELGWKSLGVLELTALPSIEGQHWIPMVQETDALLVGGGDVPYLRYWMRQSGLADLFASLLRETVYVGVSAGSLVVTSHFGDTYIGRKPPSGSDIKSEDIVLATPQGELSNVIFVVAPGIGLVDFTLFAHLDHERFPENSLANLERLAARIPVSTYAIDDQTAIKVTDGTVEIVSEGHWKLFNP
jgi:dipeptidase E